MASTINASSSSTTGIITTADNSGILELQSDGSTAVRVNTDNSTSFLAAVKETKVAVSASDIDLSLANYFSKTISGTTTFTVSNVPTTGTTASFVLDLTNGGSATVNWWSGIKWEGGTAPTLTASGRDVLGFFTHDGGTTWTGVVRKDFK